MLYHRGEKDADRFRAADPYLAGARIGDRLDLPNSLPKLVEGGRPPRVQDLAEARRDDTLRAAVEEPGANRVLEIGDPFRDRRRRDAESQGRLGHAAALDYREEHEEVVQAKLPSDAAVVGRLAGHKVNY